MDGHGGGSGSSWGARWWKGEGRPWVGLVEDGVGVLTSRGRRVRSVAGVHGNELRMVRGVTVQHPAQIIGGQRRFVARKISAGDLCAATMAQLRRGVPRLAGRFDLQWSTAQV